GSGAAAGDSAGSAVSADAVRPVPALKIGVVHAPYVRALDALYEDGADVLLAGHTHGGQVCLPGAGALVTNCDIDRGRAKVLHGWPAQRPDEGSDLLSDPRAAWLHVSAGVGTSPYAPVRFACRPEAVILALIPVADAV